MQLLVLDNYDSFTYNLVHLFRELGIVDITVARNDALTVTDAEKFTHIVLSPGPGIPQEAGIMPELVRRLAPRKKILGVCLGHQCIGEVFGARLENLDTAVHGKATEILVADRADTLFKGLPASFRVGRYHSWVINKNSVPDCLRVTARSADGTIMAIRHTQCEVHGVQFHPESVLTEHGLQLMRQWVTS